MKYNKRLDRFLFVSITILTRWYGGCCCADSSWLGVDCSLLSPGCRFHTYLGVVLDNSYVLPPPRHSTICKKPLWPAWSCLAFDVYLQLRQETSLHVCAILKHDTPLWHLRNACSACTYKVEEEPDLVFKMLVTIDGNDSLKHVIRRDPAPNIEDGGELSLVRESIEQLDERDAGADYYIPHAQVNHWVKAHIQDLLPSELKEDDDDNPCAGRWSNMVNEVTAQMWGIFDETGIFLALCHHGFALVVADMVCSGELYVQFLYVSFSITNMN